MYIYTNRLNRLLAQSCLTLCNPWAVAHQAPPSMEFSRQDYWSGLPFPSPGDLPDPGIEPRSPALRPAALLSEPPGNPLYTNKWIHKCILMYLYYKCYSTVKRKKYWLMYESQINYCEQTSQILPLPCEKEKRIYVLCDSIFIKL